MSAVVVTCPSCSRRNRVPAAAAGRPQCASCKAALPWVVDASDADFASAAGTSQLVLVDLWAPWCGPCRMVAPVLERIAARYAGRVKVVKVNVDDNPRTAARFEASSIPLLVFLKDGNAVDTLLGAHPEPEIARRIDALVG
ncbi:MAG: thioredoxin [Actinomycetales bacterium]|nr:thioredoxin [Actinomycetales bacterium]